MARITVSENGITADLRTEGSSLFYRVREQTPEATRLIKECRPGVEDLGFKLRSNRRPNYNHDSKVFFVRGSEQGRNDDEVCAQLGSEAEARQAMFAFVDMIADLSEPERRPPHPGGTTHLRQAFYPREIARTLHVSYNRHYPDQPIEWQPVEPMHSNNAHWNEHIGQGIDVLNMASTPNLREQFRRGVIHPESIDHESAVAAKQILTEAIQRAHAVGPKCSIALWRLMTALRAPDAGNMVEDPENDPENDEAAHQD